MFWIHENVTPLNTLIKLVRGRRCINVPSELTDNMCTHCQHVTFLFLVSDTCHTIKRVHIGVDLGTEEYAFLLTFLMGSNSRTHMRCSHVKSNN